MVPEWREHYVSYNRLKKILKVLSTQHLNKPPDEWTIGVSLSTPAPTNAAAMPVVVETRDDASDESSVETEGAEAPTQNLFFEILEADMNKVQAFTKLQVKDMLVRCGVFARSGEGRHAQLVHNAVNGPDPRLPRWVPQVKQIREGLKSVDTLISTFTVGSEIPIGAVEQVDAIGQRFLEIEK